MELASERETLLELIPAFGDKSADSPGFQKQTDAPRFIVNAYRQAGPLFKTWFGEKMWVVLAGPEANQFVWNNTDLWNVPIMFPGFGEQMGPDHLNVLEGKAHQHKRTVLKPAFDQASAMRYLPEYNLHYSAELQSRVGGGPFDLFEFWAETITKTNTKTVSQAEISDEALKRLVIWEEQMLAGLGLGEARHAYYSRPEYVELHQEAMALMDRIVGERLANPSAYNDNYARVLAARREQEGGYPERHCLIDDLYYIIVAGVHNTSRLINWVALQLHFTPDWMQLVREELNAWDGKNVMALAGMPHLKAVIMETQRFRPLANFVPKHSAQDFTFAGLNVPAGTDLLLANSCCHFLEEIYEDPFAFRPERFLEGKTFVPKTNGFFGGGVHICVGRNHTMLQTPLALAQMLKYYCFQYADEASLKEIVSDAGRTLPAHIAVTITEK